MSTCNCFKILANTCDSKTISSDVQKPKDTPELASALNSSPIQTHVMIPRIWKPKWEKIYIIVSAEGSTNSLKLKMEVETTDTVQRRSVMTLVDSGATGECIDQDYVKSCRFKLIKLT